ncbi:MAG: prepilin-type N-terminal cleavage/methylation domain-containing protein [Planctomycetaceae bacterium]|nr:prepilin-type N-terminal cleavage/methylation domain-containing protein [Planctomycetaceae bacterium]
MATASCARRCAMTLTELLVVVAVIAVLVTLMLPAGSNLIQRVNVTLCQNNLLRIAQTQTIQQREFDRSIAAKFTSPESWPLLVKTETGGGSILRCPEGYGISVSSSSGGGGSGGGSSDLRSAARSAFFSDYYYRIDIIPTYLSAAWSGCLPCQYFPVNNSYFVRRLSENQRVTLPPQDMTNPNHNNYGYVFWDRWPSKQADFCCQKTYVEDANPYRFWMYNEVMVLPGNFVPGNIPSRAPTDAVDPHWYSWQAGGSGLGDAWCRDSAFRIQFLEDGSTEVKIRANNIRYSGTFRPGLVKKAASGVYTEDTSYQSANGPDGRPTTTLLGPAAPTTYVDGWDTEANPDPRWFQTNPELYPTVIIPTVSGTPPPADPPPADETGDYVVSYGINTQLVGASGLSPDRVLAIDYSHLAVRALTDPAEAAEWDAAEFARHQGKLNVLFSRGNVKLMLPDEIDPRIPTNQQMYWNP